MNNLVLTGFIVACGAVLLSSNYRQIAEARMVTESAEARLRRVETRGRKLREESRRLRNLVEVEEQSIRSVREANQDSEAVANELNEAELRPEKEGFWPGEKPYFYLSKARLAGLNYWPLTDAEDNLSDTAKLLFGMSDEEGRVADAVNLTMQNKLRQLEIDHAIPTNTPARLEDKPGNKTSLFITEIPKEAVLRIMGEFRAGLEQALGPERAALLARRVDETMDGPAFNRVKGRTLTLIRNGDRIQLAELDGEGGMTSSSSTTGDGKDEIPKAFRHLFPEEK